jgi:hypothetical protein
MTLKRDNTNSKSQIKNIVTLDVYSKRYYIYKNDVFQPLAKLSYNKQNFITAYLSSKDIITASTHISRSIPEEDLPDVLEIKAYEELGLDQAVAYNISYLEVPSEEDERLFHLFVVEQEVMDNLFLPIKQETKFIDFIIPAPLLYRSLYEREIIQDTGVDAFLYFTTHDASVVFYKNGQYLYSKALPFSLEEIYDKFCEIEGEQVDKEEFFSILETEGLKATNTVYQENFMKIFGEIFIAINDIIIFTKRAYQLETIDHMYLGSTLGPIIGLDEYSNSYLGLPSFDLNFDYNIENEEWYTDQYQFLMLLTTLNYLENPQDLLNMTLYPRPPSFPQRASGQFIIATFTAISLGLAYPLYYFIGAYTKKAQVIALEPEQKRLAEEAAKYKEIIKHKQKILAEARKQLDALKTTYNEKTKTLMSVYREKVNYKLKSGLYFLLAEYLTKFDVYVDNVESEEDTLILSLVSSSERKITELIRYITNVHGDDIGFIDIQLIKKDPQTNFYRGILKVVFK